MGKQVPAEVFVRAWQTAESVDAVVEATGLKRTAACARANGLRRRGVPLQKFVGQRLSKLDMAALADLARELAPRSGAPVEPGTFAAKGNRGTFAANASAAPPRPTPPARPAAPPSRRDAIAARAGAGRPGPRPASAVATKRPGGPAF
jgi:hypothetical protein